MNSKRTDGKGRGHITAFYIETLFLTVIFVLLILALIQIFSLSVRMSDRARELTCAVQLAENAAEAVAASRSLGELAALLDENGNVRAGEDGGIYAEYDQDMRPAPGGELQVQITWEPDGNGYVNSEITVFGKGTGDPVYTLTTAVYAEEAVP